MNEVSNGPTGNQEYVEFVVVSNAVTYDCNSPIPPCIDIRGWIFDDNSGYHGNDGIAQGAVRFSQNPVWSCVPLGTIIVLYNNADRNPALPADDLSLSDGNCTIIAPLNSTLFESNITTPGAVACSYPPTGWTSGGNWANTVLANTGDCARIVNLSGCEVFSVCYGGDSLNNLIYFSGAGGQRVFYFNDTNPQQQTNWTSGSASPSPGDQTPGAPNNPANASYIGQFNNNCTPITPISVTATAVSSGCVCNGSATASAIGSIPGYTYSWYNATYQPIGQDSAVATGLCSGTYHVIATSHIGCPDTATVTVGSTGSVTLSLPSNTVCAGNSTTLTATPSVAGGQFSWSPVSGTGSSLTVSPAATTNYTCTYTVGGCTATTIATVTVQQLPVVTVNSATVCAGQSVTLTASGAGSFSWNTGSTASSITVIPSGTSVYTVTGSANGCSSVDTATVTVLPLPTVSVPAVTVCPGAAAVLTASGAASYWWSNGSTGSTITVSPSSTSSYSVVGFDGACYDTAAVTVTVSSSLVISVNSANICPGQTATLTATGASSYTWSNGMTTSSISVTPASSASYTVTGISGGCSASSITSVTVQPLPLLTVNDFTLCPGETAFLSANGAATYLWDIGATTSTISVQPAVTTSYTVTGTSSAGCTVSAIATAFVLPPPVVTVTSDTVCAGQPALLTAGGATTYLWSNGSTASSISVSPASSSNYFVVGTYGGCADTAFSTVQVLPLPAVTVNSPSVCNGQQATLSASGAISYLWSDGSTGSSLTVIPPQTTTYAVTGFSSGCSVSVSATITVRPLPVLTTTQATICAGQSATVSVSGATTYQWSNGSTGSVISVSPAATAMFTVSGTSNGCSDTAVSTVTVNPLPSLQVNSPAICPGSTAVLTATGAASYQWSNGLTGSTINVTPVATSNYTVTGSQNGCTSYAVSTVTVSNVLSVDAGQRDTVCLGSSIQLTATPSLPGNSYSWSPAAGLSANNVPDPVASPTTTAVYVVTVTDVNGCSGTDWVIIEVDPGFTITTSAVSENCNGSGNGQVSVLVSGGFLPYSYSWSNGSTAASLTGLPPASYSVSVTDAGGCTASAAATVTSPPAVSLTVTALVDATCSTSCDGSAVVNANGGTGAYSYLWSTLPVQSGSLASGLCPGSYDCTVSDVNGCSSNVAIVVDAPLPPVVDSITSVTPCSGGSTNLQVTASGGIGNYQFYWSPAAGLSDSSVYNPVANPGIATTYSVFVVDSNGCPSSPQLVAVPAASADPITLSIAGDSTVCPGESALLQVSAAAGNGGPYTFSWSPGAGLSDTSARSPAATPAATVTYTVTVNDGCSSPQSAYFTVQVLPNPIPVVSVSSPAGCAPLCVTFFGGSGNSSGNTYSWDFGDGSVTTGSPQPEYCYSLPGDYDVTFSVVSAEGCRSDTVLDGLVVVNPSPVASFTSTPEQVSMLAPAVDFSDRSTGNPVQWRWDFGDGTYSQEQNPFHVYFSDTSRAYDVVLVVSNPFGCMDTISFPLELLAETGFYLPNCFTPNGDGLNERFTGLGVGIKEYHLMIFDRWGDLIWQTRDILDGWDGRANDGLLISQQDAFDWKVVLTDVYDRQRIYLGRVSIVK